VTRLHQSASYVFGTLVRLTLIAESREADAAARAVLQEFDRLHWKLHAWKAGELVELNRAIARGATRIPLDEELASLIASAIRLSERSGGLFNPAIGRLVRCWNFHRDAVAGMPPAPAALEPLVAAAPKMSDLAVAGGDLVCGNPAVQLDFGGYAKGYALDRARLLLRERPLAGALIDIGGHIMALGRCGERPWAVGLRRPRGGGLLARLELHDGEVVSTSGDYERFFSFAGRRYCHIIDPRTGRPASSAQAATVLAEAAPDAGAVSDAASSALFVSGPTVWREVAARMGIAHALLVDAAGGMQAAGALRMAFPDPAPLCAGL
jgi:thiamine biosynthesis lipoprotein